VYDWDVFFFLAFAGQAFIPLTAKDLIEQAQPEIQG
jgi:hypothetical protein